MVEELDEPGTGRLGAPAGVARPIAAVDAHDVAAVATRVAPLAEKHKDDPAKKKKAIKKCKKKFG